MGKFDNDLTAMGTSSLTMGTTSGSNISFGGVANIDSDTEFKLKLTINKLQNELTLEKNENTHLLQKIKEMENELSTLTERIGLDSFSDKELKIILSKIHPDKNGNKESYNELTKKINLWRSQ
tara:strand:- start:8204 stop:8572 length:369 start_codon:yes stop_codon:yes gene_type:complete